MPTGQVLDHRLKGARIDTEHPCDDFVRDKFDPLLSRPIQVRVVLQAGLQCRCHLPCVGHRRMHASQCLQEQQSGEVGDVWSSRRQVATRRVASASFFTSSRIANDFEVSMASAFTIADTDAENTLLDRKTASSARAFPRSPLHFRITSTTFFNARRRDRSMTS